jgi:hypothetical protein
MQKDKIKAAIDAATKMVSAANEYLDECAKSYTLGKYVFTNTAPKQSGALRRASMELTRALAEMRKP